MKMDDFKSGSAEMTGWHVLSGLLRVTGFPFSMAALERLHILTADLVNVTAGKAGAEWPFMIQPLPGHSAIFIIFYCLRSHNLKRMKPTPSPLNGKSTTEFAVKF